MKGAAEIRGHVRQENGQVLPLVALAMVVLIGFAGLVIDIGRVWVAQQQLQGAVNAAALVAGQELPNASTAYSDAVSYSGASGDKNALGGYGVTAGSPSVTFECLSHAPNYTSGSPPTCPADTSNANCQPAGAQAPQPSGATTCNAVSVAETATVKTTFLGLFGPSFTVSASAIAGARGGIPHPLDVYVILDNTKSMIDTACTSTVTGIPSGDQVKLDCAKAGVRTLLQSLWPCSDTLSSCGAATRNSGGELGANVANPVDEVGMLVTPAISGNPPSTSTLTDETDCNTTETFSDLYPPWTSYTWPDAIPASDEYLGYQAIGLSSDYRPSDSNTTLNGTTSNLAESVDWGLCPPYPSGAGTYPSSAADPWNYGLKDIGGHGSYLAGAITEAQYLLQQNERPGATNAIIIESDGEMTDPTDFSNSTESKTACLDAYNAAAQAKAAGTTVYTIEYDSNGTCGPDSPTDTYDNADTLMQDMASSSETYFDDPSAGDLTQTFQQVSTDLTDSRLIPNCTAAPPGC
jgi:Putative Flp pilus-assembly TadE/G-like